MSEGGALAIARRAAAALERIAAALEVIADSQPDDGEIDDVGEDGALNRSIGRIVKAVWVDDD